MKKKIILILCVLFVFVSCTKKETEQEKLAKKQLAELEEKVKALKQEMEAKEKELSEKALKNKALKNKASSNSDDLLDSESSNILYGKKSLFPTEYDYLKPEAKYKTLIAWKKWHKRGIERFMDNLPEDGDNWGRKYTDEDVGLMELQSAKSFDKNANLIINLEEAPYQNMFPWMICEYDDLGRKVKLMSSLFYSYKKPFTEDFYKELESKKHEVYTSYEYKDIQGETNCWMCTEYENTSDKKEQQGKIKKVCKKNKLNDLMIAEKDSVKKIQIPNFKAISSFCFNDKAQLVEIKTKAYYGWCLSDTKYDGNNLIEASFYLLGRDKIEKYKFTKFDAYGNWLEADVYVGDDEEISYTKLREITYYE